MRRLRVGVAGGQLPSADAGCPRAAEGPEGCPLGPCAAPSDRRRCRGERPGLLEEAAPGSDAVTECASVDKL